MFVAGSDGRIAIAADWRLNTDRDLDESEPSRTHALDLWRLGRFCLGKRWLHALRVALFEHGAKPTAGQAAAARARFVAWLEAARPKRLYILPTPDSTLGGEGAALKGTHCWQALHAPDTLEAMRGTRWAFGGQTEVIPLYPDAKRVKELQRWCSANWLKAWAMPTLEPCPERTAIHPSHQMLSLLEKMAARPLAVDLEFNPTTDIVTAIGLSDGERAVSVPFDEFCPRGTSEVERGLTSYGPIGRLVLDRIRRLLRADTTKIAHNFVADIPRLERKGFVVNGKLHDTFAAHAIAFPELRHGLQHATASMLPVPPWKSLYKPIGLAKGITRDDEEYWQQDAIALRTYNYRDAYFTHRLAQALMPHVGETL